MKDVNYRNLILLGRCLLPRLRVTRSIKKFENLFKGIDYPDTFILEHYWKHYYTATIIKGKKVSSIKFAVKNETSQHMTISIGNVVG